MLLLVLGVLAEGVAAFGYCVIQDGVSQCTSNYRTLTAGNPAGLAWSAGSNVAIFDGNDQVMISLSWWLSLLVAL